MSPESSTAKKSNTRRCLVRAVPLTTLAIAGAAAYWLGNHGLPARAPNGGLVVPQDCLHFGDAWEQEAFPWQLSLHNPTAKPVRIRAFISSCICLAVHPQQLVVPAGGKANVHLTLDLTYTSAENNGAHARQFEVTIAPLIDGLLAEPPGWSIRGSVRRYLVCEPPEVRLVHEPICGRQGPTLQVSIQPTIRLSRLWLKRIPEGWSAELVHVQGAYVLRSRPCKTTSGPFTDTFELQATNDAGQILPVHRITVHGCAADVAEVLPRPMDLGQVSVGKIAEGRLWICPRNNETINGVDVTSSDRLMKVRGFQRDGQKWYIDLERRVDMAGPGMSEGSIRLQSSGAYVATAGFRLRWYGITH